MCIRVLPAYMYCATCVPGAHITLRHILNFKMYRYHVLVFKNVGTSKVK